LCYDYSMKSKPRITTIDPLAPLNKTVKDVVKERDAHRALVRNLAGGPSTVQITWGMNDDSVAAQVCIIKIGDKQAYVRADDMMRYLRWV
jgi:hypothetical protein